MNKRIVIYNTLFFLFAIATAYTQSVELRDWQVHTSMLNVQTAATDTKNRIWLGTSGGITLYDPLTNDTTIMNQITGLLSADIRKICQAPDKELLIAGTIDGVIELIHEDLRIEHVTSIRDHNFTNPSIRDIIINGNDVYIAGNFGVTVFDLSQMVFTNTAETIGTLPKNTPAGSIVLHRDTLWVATPGALASIPVQNKSHMNIPYNWTIYTYPEINGLAQTFDKAKIAELHDTLYINMGKRIYAFANNEYTQVFERENPDNTNYDYLNIIDIGVYNNEIVYSSINFLNNLAGKNLFANWDVASNGFQVLSNSNADIVYFYQLLGAEFINKNLTTKLFTPSTPVSNNFLAIAVAPNGKVYAVSDDSEANKTKGGVMGFDGKKWTNFNNTNSPGSPIYVDWNFNAIAAGQDNKVYASGWGSGLYIIEDNPDSTIYTNLNSRNSPLNGLNSTNEFVIVGQTAFDTKGNPWVTNYTEAQYSDGKGTVIMGLNYSSEEYKFYAFDNKLNPNDRNFFDMAIDNYGTKWICGAGEGSGVIYFNDKNTPDDPRDDIWGKMSTSSHPNLLDNKFHCCVVDNSTGNSEVFFGTLSGVSKIYYTYPASNSSDNSKIKVEKIALLAGQNVHDIIVDAVGNKWIATDNGVWVINQTCDTVLTIFNKSNSPLISDGVFSLATNYENGLIYIGTKNGLYIAQSSFVQAAKNYSISVYPQPFKIDADKYLTITGLVTSSEVKIITPDGKLVKTFNTNSKNLIWDGKDNDGNKVPPGVYVVIGNSSTANSSAAGKIAIVE